MIAQLHQQHEELQTLAHRLDNLVQAPEPDMRSLGQLRLAMSTLLRNHINFEEEQIYAPLRALPEASSEITRSDEDLRTRQMAYSSHISAWRLERIAPEWMQYGREVQVLTRGLVTRIGYENEVIYPLFHRLNPCSQRN